MEKLADKGNGNYAYIDSLIEARKVLVEEAGSTLVTIAKDVKIQVEFNPTEVESFRLIGYENRVLAHSDFNDDSKDAGEIGAGHTVTALYEVVPAGSAERHGSVDPLKYTKDGGATQAAASGELMTVKVRYKDPDGDRSKLSEFAIDRDANTLASSSADFRFAAAVAEFGLVLRDSEFKGEASLDQVTSLAANARGADPTGSRREFIALVDKARELGIGTKPLGVAR
jgi:Ca-activated chloride channel family protein